MNENSKILHDVWDKASGKIASGKIEFEISEFNSLLTSIFSPGANYYYIVDFFDREIKQMSSSIETLLGLDSLTVTFEDIINSIHPDDLPFVSQAEEMAINYFYNEIGKENILKYKVCYNFRSKVADGSYQLFHHQAIVLSVDEVGGFGKSLNIHTNINHITTINNFKIQIIGIEDETDSIQLEVINGNNKVKKASFFSKRESEIINLVSLGFKNSEIASKLFISEHTVKNHRKNILKKAGTKSSSELIAKCINEGLI